MSMNAFTHPVTQAYDLSDASVEIIVMLVVAFLLGCLAQYFCSKLRFKFLSKAKEDAGEFARFAKDDLKIVEGIGPKIEELLKAEGINTWEDLANTSVERLKDILQKGGDRFKMHEPTTWPDQAKLAHDGKWKDLAEYQDFLIGGRG